MVRRSFTPESFGYPMESLDEAERLEMQAEAEKELITDLLKESQIQRGMIGLDVGCGTGAITRRLAQLVGSSGKVYGVDKSRQRLQAAKILSESQGIDNIVFLEGDAQKIDIPELVDFAWARYLLEYFNDPEAKVRAMMRVVKPNGIIAAHDIDGWTFVGMEEDLLSRFQKTLARLQEETGLDTLIGQKLAGLFANCGLSGIQAFPHQHNFKTGAASSLIISDWKTRLDTLRPHTVIALGSVIEADRFQQDMMLFLENPQTTMHTNTMFVVGMVPLN